LPRSGEFLQYVIDEWPLRLIALHTVIAGRAGGTLCETRLEWLAARLAEQPTRPTIVAMHHPPFLSGLAEMDRINCANSTALGVIVARHPQIERIICGHVHRPMCVRWRGTVVTTVPATTLQFDYSLKPDSPVSWLLEPPACYLHHWQPDAGLVTHLSYIGSYGPATPIGD